MIYIQGSNKYGNSKQRGMTRQAEVKSFTFPGGEQQITLPDFNSHLKLDTITVTAVLQNAKDIMDLVLTRDAVLLKYGIISTELKMGYVPYARQDRVANKGESLAARSFGKLINSLDFDIVTILDPHSQTIVDSINNVTVVDQLSVISYGLYDKILSKEVTVVAPDKGSTEKVKQITKNFIQGTKLRDTKTGKLSGFGYEGDPNGLDLIIIDDICDGGGTFIGLTKELLKGGAKSVSLFVSHGIFSKGLDILLDNGIDHIYTTNSLPQVEHNKLTVTYWR